MSFTVKMMDRIYDPADYPNTEKNVLYVCESGNLSWHICPCDQTDMIKEKCPGRIVRTRLDSDWTFTFDGDIPTISPSISNVSLPCKSHYVLTAGELRFLPPTPDYLNPYKGQEIQFIKS